MTDVNGTTRAPLRLLLVDATCNKQQFEYDVSAQICNELASRGVPLAESTVLTPTDFPGLLDALDSGKREYSALLYFAHGSAGNGQVSASVQVGKFSASWELLGRSGMDLSDKFLSFCVCHGSCEEMIDGMVRGEAFALTVLAPNATLAKSEALQFFPAFFQSLVPLTRHEIDPNHVREKMGLFNLLAHEKMRVFP